MPKWNGEGVRNITMPVEAVEPFTWLTQKLFANYRVPPLTLRAFRKNYSLVK
jgi:hypothetical protein